MLRNGKQCVLNFGKTVLKYNSFPRLSDFALKFLDCSEDFLADDRQTKESTEGAEDDSIGGRRSCNECALSDGSHLMTSERSNISRLVVEPGDWKCTPEAASDETQVASAVICWSCL